MPTKWVISKHADSNYTFPVSDNLEIFLSPNQNKGYNAVLCAIYLNQMSVVINEWDILAETIEDAQKEASRLLRQWFIDKAGELEIW